MTAPALETARLAVEHWRQGYASEAARAASGYGFSRLGLAEIVSFTAALNLRSQRVMTRIGLRRATADDFDHPLVPAGHPLRRHVLYRLAKADWRLSAQAPGVQAS